MRSKLKNHYVAYKLLVWRMQNNSHYFFVISILFDNVHFCVLIFYCLFNVFEQRSN